MKFLPSQLAYLITSGIQGVDIPLGSSDGMSKIVDDQGILFRIADMADRLIKIAADSGEYGIGEAYGSPGIGVKEQVLSLKPWLVGKDPLEIDTIYTLLGIDPRQKLMTADGRPVTDDDPPH